MNCPICGLKIKRLKKGYFGSNLRCVHCGSVVETWEMTLHDYWMDFLMLIGIVHQEDKG